MIFGSYIFSYTISPWSSSSSGLNNKKSSLCQLTWYGTCLSVGGIKEPPQVNFWNMYISSADVYYKLIHLYIEVLSFSFWFIIKQNVWTIKRTQKLLSWCPDFSRGSGWYCDVVNMEKVERKNSTLYKQIYCLQNQYFLQYILIICDHWGGSA